MFLFYSIHQNKTNQLFSAIFQYYQQLRWALELSQVVSFILSSIFAKSPQQPAFRTRKASVSCLLHFCSRATSGRNVPEQFLPLCSAFITIPCFPTSQSQGFYFCSKLTRSETATLSYLTSSPLTGGNLGSFIEAVIAYSVKTLESFPGAKVPIQPLKSPFFFHVTKTGTSGSSSWLGKGGICFPCSFERRTPKQYLQ